jgi:hypothetical protein
MISTQGYFLEYLESLMSEFEASILGGRFPGLESILQGIILV